MALYYPKSNYWDQLANKRALGYAISPQQLRAAMEGERLGELSAYYSEADKQRNRDLENKRLEQQNTQFYSSQNNTNANLDKTLTAQETAAKTSLMIQAPITAMGVYGLGKKAGMWGGETPPTSVPGNSTWYDKTMNWINPKPTTSPYSEYNTGTGFEVGDYNADFPASYDQITGPDSAMNMGGMPANTGLSGAEAPALSTPYVAGEYGAQGGIGTGIGEAMSTLGPIPGIGQTMAAMYGVGKLAEWGIPKLDRAIGGASRYLQEIPTEEILQGYQSGNWGSGGVAPIWEELKRRGVTGGLTPPSTQDIEKSYVNWADTDSTDRYYQKWGSPTSNQGNSLNWGEGV